MRVFSTVFKGESLILGVSNCAAGAKKIGVFADLRGVFGNFRSILAPILVLNPPLLKSRFLDKGGGGFNWKLKEPTKKIFNL